MAQQGGRTFEDMQSRLEQIVEEVSAEDISLDDALALYEEAVKLGLAACDLSESDVEAYLAASSSTEEGAGGEEGAVEASAAGDDGASTAPASSPEEDGAAPAGSPAAPAEED